MPFLLVHLNRRPWERILEAMVLPPRNCSGTANGVGATQQVERSRTHQTRQDLMRASRPESAMKDARLQVAETTVPNTLTCDLRVVSTPTAVLSIERWTQQQSGAVQTSRNLSLHCHRRGGLPCRQEERART